MSIRTRILVAVLALGAIGVPVASDARVYVDVDVAPPPPRVEVVPAPRVGYVWAPGYWVRERRGYHWRPHRWEEHDGRWRFDRGRWER